MCGIVGFDINGKAFELEELLNNCTRKLGHRGPDNQGTFIRNSIHIGHTRLKIVDLSEGANQPLNYEHKVIVSFNGEIYNFEELKKALQKLSYSFKTQSDTEVIAAAYLAWGIHCLDRFEGMFALCIYDLTKNKIFLARDIFGKKPLYYTTDPFFSFSSELNTFTQLLPQLNIRLESVNQFLSIGYVLNPITMYEEVQALAPAHYLTYHVPSQSITISSYWSYADAFRAKKTYRHQEDAIAETRALLFEAIEKRTLGDVPYGIFLSAGIDSGAIASILKKVYKLTPPCFNIGFKQTKYDESAFASQLAQELGLPFQSIDLSSIAFNKFEKYIKEIDNLSFDNSSYPIYQLARMAAKQVKFVLTGDGSDELFGGYITYRADTINRNMKAFIPLLKKLGISARIISASANHNDKIGWGTKLNRFFKGIDPNYRKAHYNWRSIFSVEERIAILGKQHEELIRDTDPFYVFDKHYEEVKDLDLLEQHLYVDAKTWLSENNLMKLDVNTMAHGLEARSPFLDRKLVSHVASLDISYKKDKALLKKVLSDYLPAKYLNHKKSGFNSPVHLWLNSTSDEFQAYTKFIFDKKYANP